MLWESRGSEVLKNYGVNANTVNTEKFCKPRALPCFLTIADPFRKAEGPSELCCRCRNWGFAVEQGFVYSACGEVGFCLLGRYLPVAGLGWI